MTELLQKQEPLLSVPCINLPPNIWNEFVWTHFMFAWPFLGLQIQKNSTAPTLSAICPPTHIYIYCLHQPSSNCMKQVHLNLFHVDVIFLALQIQENSTVCTPSAICPPYPTFYLSPAPTDIQRPFELVLCPPNIPSPTMDPWKLNSSPLSDIHPSYTHFHLLPASTCIQMQEMSLFELVSYPHNIPSQTDTCVKGHCKHGRDESFFAMACRVYWFLLTNF